MQSHGPRRGALGSFFGAVRGGVMADKLTLWVEVAAGREFIPVKSIGRLISDALLYEIESKHAGSEPGQFDEAHDAATEDSFDLGFAYKGTDPETIRRAVLKCRADGSLVVHEAEGRGTIHDDNVMRGSLTREGLVRLLAAEWKVGLLEECGPLRRTLSIEAAQLLPEADSTCAALESSPEPVAVSASGLASPALIPTSLFASCFVGLKWNTAKEWKTNLGKKPKWLAECATDPGRRGGSEARWDPLKVGAALVLKWGCKSHIVRARFQKQPHLKPWLQAWDAFEAEHLASA